MNYILLLTLPVLLAFSSTSYAVDQKTQIFAHTDGSDAGSLQLKKIDGALNGALWKDNVGHITKELLHEATGATLPKTLDSLGALQNYAAYHARARNNSIAHFTRANPDFLFDTATVACTRFSLSKDLPTGCTRDRIQIIYDVASRLRRPCFPKSTSSFTDIYFAIKYRDDAHKNKIKNQFHNFLMVNNRELLPNYERLLTTAFHHMETVRRESVSFIAQIELLEPQQIAKWMKMANFSADEKSLLIRKLTGINRDIAVMANYLRHVVTDIDALQILDVLHLAELVFDVSDSLEDYVKSVTENGLLFPTSNGEFSFYQRHTVANGLYEFKHTSGQLARRDDVAHFFRHRQFPFRSLSLFVHATSLLLRDFLERVRSDAGLPPVPETIFASSPILNAACAIDKSLAPIEEMVAQQLRRREVDVFGRAMSFSETQASKKKEYSGKAKKSKSKASKKTTKKPTRIVAPTQRELPKQEPETVMDERPLSAQVFDLLNSDEQELFRMLCAMERSHLTRALANKLVLGVYRALVDLQQTDIAIGFLKKQSDTRLHLDNPSVDDSTIANQKRLAIFLMHDLVHPSFTKDAILVADQAVNEQVLAEKIIFSGKRVRGAIDIERFLDSCEEIIAAASALDRRALMINLAYSWHRFARELEQQRTKTAAEKIILVDERITSLLTRARAIKNPRGVKSTTVLEAYLMDFYLDIHESPACDELTDEDFAGIQARAMAELAKGDQKLPSFAMLTVDEKHNELPRTLVHSSIFHAMTNSEVDDFVMLKFSTSVKERKIPLFITVRDKIYRTDVFGGSRLRPKAAEEDYGSLIAVSLRAAQFFKRWFTSEESFWYGQRAFMPRSEGAAPMSLHGRLRVATIPDDDNYTINQRFIVHDGFGYIKASVAAQLGLRGLERRSPSFLRNVAYQALQSYEMDRDAAREIYAGLRARHESGELNGLSPKDRANGYMATMPKLTAVGVPISGNNIMLPSTKPWTTLQSSDLLLGRNPYSAMSLQWVKNGRVKNNAAFDSFRVFQYSLTGLYDEAMGAISGSFFKGLLGVIDDRDWPREYADVDIIMSSKDEKLNQAWLTEEDKKHDQQRGRRLSMHGVLFVTDDMYKKQVMGLPPALTDKLAGDFDGDEYDVLVCARYPKVCKMVRTQSGNAIANPKITKSFTKRRHEGNHSRILALRKPILSTWNSIQNRFYHLTPNDRAQLACVLAPTNLLKIWLGEEQAAQFVDVVDVITAEMQLGIKFGEDIFKTSVDSQQVMDRARVYEQALHELSSSLSVPYGSSLRKKLMANGDVSAAMSATLTTTKSGNVVDKAARAFSRYANPGYLFNDEDDVSEEN